MDDKAEDPVETPGSLNAAIDMEKQSVGEALTSLLRVFQYTTTLPDALRHAGNYASEWVRESANWFVPSAFRNSESYSLFVRQLMDFVIREGASAEGQSDAAVAAASPERAFVARKTFGSLLDMTALATFHLSPLTVLAVFAEYGFGAKIFLQQLVDRLREQQLIAADVPIDSSAELIAVLERVTEHATEMFGRPPISISGLNKTVAEIAGAVARVAPEQMLPLAEIDQLLRQMELAAREQEASIWDVSATISLVALNSIHSVGQGGLVTLDVDLDLFQEHIIQHYWEGLRAIERHGLLPTLTQASEPYLESVWTNYAIRHKSWAEQLLHRDLLKWGWSQLGWPKLSRG